MGKTKKTNRDRDKQLASLEYGLGMHSKQMQELFVLLAQYIEMRGDTSALTEHLTRKARERLSEEPGNGSSGSFDSGISKVD